MKEIENWLRGTTCHHHMCDADHRDLTDDLRTIIAASHRKKIDLSRLWLLKHRGHSEYLGRWSGVKRCGTYYCLYDLNNVLPRTGFGSGFGYGGGYIKKWEGRWTKAKEAELWEEVKKYLEEE